MEPRWVNDAVFYLVNPDRFEPRLPSEMAGLDAAAFEPWDTPPSHKAYKGGSLNGVTRKLDYLQELGVNALLLTPIFTSPTHHRYKPIDFFHVDPMLGGNAAFKQLLMEAHQRGIKVVLDGVFNHVGLGFPRFQDLMEYGRSSPWRNWFVAENWPAYECWNQNRTMPVLNYGNPAVAEYILGVAEYWIRKGVDGWRLDAPQRIDAPGFWQRMRDRVHAVNSEAYLFGECWEDASPWLDGGQWHGATNYPLMGAIHRFAAGARLKVEHLLPGTPPQIPLDAAGFARELDWLNHRYPAEIVTRQFNFVGTHDTSRFRTLCGEDEDIVELATAILMAIPGAPCIYYGDEVGMTGGPPPASRGGFPERDRWNLHVLEYHRRLIALRRSHPALRSDRCSIVYAEGSCLALERSSAEGRVLSIFNAGEGRIIPKFPALTQKLYGRAEYAGESVSVPPRSASFWEI